MLDYLDRTTSVPRPQPPQPTRSHTVARPPREQAPSWSHSLTSFARGTLARSFAHGGVVRATRGSPVRPARPAVSPCSRRAPQPPRPRLRCGGRLALAPVASAGESHRLSLALVRSAHENAGGGAGNRRCGEPRARRSAVRLQVAKHRDAVAVAVVPDRDADAVAVAVVDDRTHASHQVRTQRSEAPTKARKTDLRPVLLEHLQRRRLRTRVAALLHPAGQPLFGLLDLLGLRLELVD